MPLLKNLLYVVYAWYGSIKDKGSISVTKSSSVPMSKYLDLRQNYLTQTTILETALKQETGTLTKLYDLQKKEQLLELTVNNLQKEKIESNRQVHDLKIQISENEIQANAFEILYAEYGRHDSYIDVTSVLTNLMKTGFTISINNGSLANGKDPAQDKFKKLKILYKNKGLYMRFEALEDEILKILQDTFESQPTDESLRKKRSEDHWEILKEIFKGEWILDSTLNGRTQQESVLIDNQGRYFSNGEQVFNLLYIDIDMSTKAISFVKRFIDKKGTYSKESLRILPNHEISGNDDKGRTLLYRKLKI